MNQAPTIPQQARVTPVTRTSTPINYKRLFLLWIIAQQYINVFALIWVMLVPEASRGLAGLMQRDFHITPPVILVFSLFSLGVTLRGASPRYGLLLSQVGQGLTALFALGYTLHGDISLSQLAGHGGLFALNAIGIAAMAQYSRPMPRRVHLSTVLIPTIAIILVLYALGIASRPDMGVSRFIDAQFRSPLNDLLLAWFALSAGYVILNHIHPSKLFVALTPMMIYALMAAAFLGSDNGVSIGGIFVHLMLFFSMMIVVMLQTREYARVTRNDATGV